MQANLEGNIHIALQRHTQQVQVSLKRPLAVVQRFLLGKTPEQVLVQIPMLFTVCSHAQSLAALMAIQQALGVTSDSELRAAQQQLVNLETQREHVLRIFLHWAASVQQPVSLLIVRQAMQFLPQAKQAWFQQGQAFALDTKLKETSTKLSSAWQAFLAEHIFGMAVDEWRGIKTLNDLDHWVQRSTTVAALALKQLQTEDLGRVGCNDFPLDQESSVLKRQAQQALLQESLVMYGNGLWTRYLARLVELAHAPVWLEGKVAAARGDLQHSVQLDTQQQVSSYQILAPTDANFAKQAVVARGLQQILLTVVDEQALNQRADLWITAIDPCVTYQLEVQDA